MWPQKFLKILVPRTPPDPPLPPLTPPRGPGGPKMAKMHSLKSIDDNLCQKSHFWGVKKIDLFFHSECTIGVEVMTLLVRLSVAEGSLHVRNTSRDLSVSREVFALPVDEEILLRDFYAKVRIFDEQNLLCVKVHWLTH